MRNKTCVNVGTDGQTATALGGEKSLGTEAVKRSRVPLYRVMLDRTGSIMKEGTKFVTEPREAARLFREFIGDAPEEHFCLMVLDARRRVIGLSEVSVGTLSASLVHPRLCFAKHKRGYVAAGFMLRPAARSVVNTELDIT